MKFKTGFLIITLIALTFIFGCTQSVADDPSAAKIAALENKVAVLEARAGDLNSQTHRIDYQLWKGLSEYCTDKATSKFESCNSICIDAAEYNKEKCDASCEKIWRHDQNNCFEEYPMPQGFEYNPNTPN